MLALTSLALWQRRAAELSEEDRGLVQLLERRTALAASHAEGGARPASQARVCPCRPASGPCPRRLLASASTTSRSSLLSSAAQEAAKAAAVRAVKTAARLAESAAGAAAPPEAAAARASTRVAVDGAGRATPMMSAEGRGRRGRPLELAAEGATPPGPPPRPGGPRPAAVDELDELLFGTDDEAEPRAEKGPPPPA